MNQRTVSRRIPRAVIAAIFLTLTFLPQALAGSVRWSLLFSQKDLTEDLSTPEGRAKALAFCRRMGVGKVYLGVSGWQADPAVLKEARDYFLRAGIPVSGVLATYDLGKSSTQWKIVSCYTNRETREHLRQAMQLLAGVFDEVILDDWFFTDCQCSECAAAKGSMSWQQYRRKLMLHVSQEDILQPARQVNPRVKVIVKFPNWYDGEGEESYENRGYAVVPETELFDGIWVGTETRDPSTDGHVQQYRGFFLDRWLSAIGGKKTGGAWFDPFDTTPALYLDQAYVTVLAGAPEIILFHYGSLASKFPAQADALAANRKQLDSLSKLVGSWNGIPAYKPSSSSPGKEPYLFDKIGMLGIPLIPTPVFPSGSPAAIFTEDALGDFNFVPELNESLQAGGTTLISAGLAHRLAGDPRLPSALAWNLEEGTLVESASVGPGRIVIFSDALPQLAFVDKEDRTEQVDPQMRIALEELRRVVSQFTVTLLDAPPRVAVFPMGKRIAVYNFTELPVTCRPTGVTLGARRKQAFSSAGASLDADGVTLHLPPHSLAVLE